MSRRTKRTFLCSHLTAPHMEMIRRPWLGDTGNFCSARDNIRSKVPLYLEFTE